MGRGTIVEDDFLDDFEDFNEWAREQDYGAADNPFDGMEYPNICTEIDPKIGQELVNKISASRGRDVKINAIFLRLNLPNTAGAPHQAHNDVCMGEVTGLLYLQDGPGGTSMVRHKYTGMCNGTPSTFEAALWKRDTNIPEAWEIDSMVEMKKNRLVHFPSIQMHRAEPIGGFGENVDNGRLVLCAFMNYE